MLMFANMLILMQKKKIFLAPKEKRKAKENDEKSGEQWCIRGEEERKKMLKPTKHLTNGVRWKNLCVVDEE